MATATQSTKMPLDAAIKRFMELSQVKTSEKPAGVSDKWWEQYSAVHDPNMAEKPRGERGVKALISKDATDAEFYTIKIYGEIAWYTLEDFDYFLSQAGKKKVKVRIASPGGNASVGLQIYNVIRKRGNVVTETDGPIASAASIIFLGGQERLVNETAMTLMVHRSWIFSFIMGNAEEWKKTYNEARKVMEAVDIGMIEALNARSKLSKAKSREFINEETWFQPEDCVKYGIATGYCAEPSGEEETSNEDTTELKQVVSSSETKEVQASDVSQETTSTPKVEETEVKEVETVVNSTTYQYPVPLHLLGELG